MLHPRFPAAPLLLPAPNPKQAILLQKQPEKDDYLRQKEEQAKERKRQNQIKRIETRISEIENRINALDERSPGRMSPPMSNV